MQILTAPQKTFFRSLVVAMNSILFLFASQSANAGTPSQNPIFLESRVVPLMMLNMPKEHQLYFKLYDDYSDITSPTGGDPDFIPDLTYNNNYDYYGYFDSNKCYVYNTTKKRFEPSALRDSAKSCVGTDDWSGNFLNWGSMTRIDAIRKILYGGLRAAGGDTATETVLERAFLPNDAHSFAKFYIPTSTSSTALTTTQIIANLKNIVPDGLATVSGLTLCNTTEPADRSTLSQNATGVNDVPLIRVAKGNYSLWASNERWQCRWWATDVQGDNGNTASSGISAAAQAPVRDDIAAANGNPARTGVGFGEKDYYARVQVCASGLLETKCKAYGTSNKPIGLLQNYGETDSIYFGLITGSYVKNKSGGVLRRAASSFKNEVNASTGVFLKPANSIINTLDSFRITGYRFDDGTYFGKTGSDNCSWAINTFSNGNCTNWGNPQAEIYLESLRYLAGKQAPNFEADDSSKITGLTRISSASKTPAGRGVDWTDPIDLSEAGNYCAPLNVLQFNASTTSYDTDDLTSASDVLADADKETDSIGLAELINGNNYFIGNNGDGANDGLCTSKKVSILSKVQGSCPEAPRLEGGFKIAGLAYSARRIGIANDRRQKVKTYGVALASALPKVELTLPGTGTLGTLNSSGLPVTPARVINIIPACHNEDIKGNCAIVDFKVLPQTITGTGSSTVITGKLYVNWEDSEQGGDFDQDMWGVIDYTLSSTSLSIKPKVVAKSTPDRMGFGYIISGTGSSDGYKVNAGINNFDEGECTAKCNVADAAVAHAYPIATLTSVSNSLELPLYYAAKWGGYKDDTATAAIIKATNPLTHGDGTYYFASNPKALEDGLDAALDAVSKSVGSGATAAVNSTSLDGDTRTYQARFNSDDWSGRVLAYGFDTVGKVNAVATWDTDTTLAPTTTGRKIYTFNGAYNSAAALLTTTSAPADLISNLTVPPETDTTVAMKRLSWLLGNAITGLRERKTSLLGDIVNSDPGFAGTASQRYERLPSNAGFGASKYAKYVSDKAARKSALFVGANDGMLHAFDAANGNELFAYVPRGVYSKLAKISAVTYKGNVHQYLVDGPVYVSDVYNGTEWRTIVAGTLGAGGRGAYALDVTDVLTGSGAPKVIFDISAEDSFTPSAVKNDLGYSYSKVLVVPTEGGRWAAVFGNGTNSNNGYSKLITIDVNSLSFNTVDTKAKGSGLDNGLSGVAFLPGSTGVITTAYAGDILGNMWKFDLTNADITKWVPSYGTASSPKPLITVADSSTAHVVQPITAAPTLGLNAVKLTTSYTPSVMVYFGTGKYIESADKSNTQVQSLYAIADTGVAITLGSNRSTQLQEKVISEETTTKRKVINDKNDSTGNAAVDWKNVNITGWFMDLKVAGGSNSGERIISKPLLLFDRIIMNTFIPSDLQCLSGGKGWLMELVGVGDVFISHQLLTDLANTKLDAPILGDLTPLSGKKSEILGNTLDDKTLIIPYDPPLGTIGRMSWRQLK